ncbi:MAG: YggS family pyridoxal phosphate-dependent enzyme [Mycoplasmatales bacterium]
MNTKHTQSIVNSIDSNIKLVVVTKNRSIKDIEKIYNIGIRDFGENKLQEITNKKDIFKDINWHFIGRIQTNKIKDIVKFSSLIHSVSSYKIINTIQKESLKQDKIQDILIQFNIAGEETKSGFNIDEYNDVITYYKNLSNINVIGIMLMGPNTNDDKLIETIFTQGLELKNKMNLIDPNIKELSMGMSNDYKIAIKNKSTILRIGSLLFE